MSDPSPPASIFSAMHLRVGYADPTPADTAQLDQLAAYLVAVDDNGNTQQLRSARIGPIGFISVGALGSMWFSENAFLHEDNNWYRVNPAAGAFAAAQTPSAWVFYTTSAGTGPIAWTQVAVINQNGYQLAGIEQRGVVAIDGDTIVMDGQGKIRVNDSGKAMTIIGPWNAAANTPALASGVGTQGHAYLVTTAGTTNLDGHASWPVGSMAVFAGNTYFYVPPTGVAQATVTRQTVGIVAGVLTIDYSLGRHVEVTVDQNITSIVYQNLPAAPFSTSLLFEFHMGGSGGYSIAWPSNHTYPGGTPSGTAMPGLSGTVGATDLFSAIFGSSTGKVHLAPGGAARF